ncbi:hypothetical protein [Spartinivicinus ruber]|uniref:hypothetical protein n=1 Tax=Spartinivicinus ruber TaxID=2683272 RepID=UPI0013D7322C|nr:hypothetical protein [Spartinivicinus ruber]
MSTISTQPTNQNSSVYQTPTEVRDSPPQTKPTVADELNSIELAKMLCIIAKQVACAPLTHSDKTDKNK